MNKRNFTGLAAISSFLAACGGGGGDSSGGSVSNGTTGNGGNLGNTGNPNNPPISQPTTPNSPNTTPDNPTTNPPSNPPSNPGSSTGTDPVNTGGNNTGNTGGNNTGGNTNNPGDTTAPVTGGVYIYSKPNNQYEAARFLLQTQFATNLTEINSLVGNNYVDYLNAQFNMPILGTASDWVNSRGYNVADNHAYFDNTYLCDFPTWQQVFTAKDNLRKKVALALSEFFVVSINGLNISWRTNTIASWWDMLNSKCFTTYRELLGAVTLHPAMGTYLNLAGSKKENSAGRQPDENYAREVMQLFSLGLYQLNIDGTEKTDGSGNKIDTYTQNDITNLARAFTGWNYNQSQNSYTAVTISGVSRNVPNSYYTTLPMVFNAGDHSTQPASFLGANMPADGASALTAALDTIANHPNVAPFFCKQMIKKFVTSNPSREYVARVASVFNNNGAGVRGDLKAVFSCIFLDPEARNPANVAIPTFGKVREPMHRFIQWGKTFKLNSKFGSWKLGDLTSNLGQSPFRSPSVFNFFRPNYVPPSTQLAALNLTGPEFQIINESTVSSYINFMQSVIKSGFLVSGPDVPYNNTSTANDGYDIAPDYTEALAFINDSTALVNYLDLILNAGMTSETNKKTIISAIDSFGINTTNVGTVDNRLNKLASAILLIMSNTDYIIQK